MLAWQQLMLGQIIFGSLMAIWYRKVALKNKKSFYLVGLGVYFIVALAGVFISFVHFNFSIPDLPSLNHLINIVLASSLITISWLMSFKLLSNIGAFSMAIASSLNYLTIATFAIIFLNDNITISFILGALVMIIASFIAVLNPELDKKTKKQSYIVNFGLLLAVAITLAVGILYEKIAINAIGVWSYAFYGWIMQFISASVIFVLFGRHEIKQINLKLIKYISIAGILTAIAGTFFILALSYGQLSSIALSASAKVSLTAVLAVLLLGERTFMKQRFLALGLSLLGLMFIFN